MARIKSARIGPLLKTKATFCDIKVKQVWFNSEIGNIFPP